MDSNIGTKRLLQGKVNCKLHQRLTQWVGLSFYWGGISVEFVFWPFLWLCPGLLYIVLGWELLNYTMGYFLYFHSHREAIYRGLNLVKQLNVNKINKLVANKVYTGGQGKSIWSYLNLHWVVVLKPIAGNYWDLLSTFSASKGNEEVQVKSYRRLNIVAFQMHVPVRKWCDAWYPKRELKSYNDFNIPNSVQ